MKNESAPSDLDPIVERFMAEPVFARAYERAIRKHSPSEAAAKAMLSYYLSQSSFRREIREAEEELAQGGGVWYQVVGKTLRRMKSPRASTQSEANSTNSSSADTAG